MDCVKDMRLFEAKLRGIADRSRGKSLSEPNPTRSLSPIIGKNRALERKVSKLDGPTDGLVFPFAIP